MVQAAVQSANSVDQSDDRPWVGRSIARIEDAALLSGRGRFIDDLGVAPGTLHATILRSPHAHADILSIDAEAAKRLPGVTAVLTGEDVKAVTTTLVVGVKAPVECWPIAMDRVRYVGEPVAVVVATDRARAEDGAELINVEYRPRGAVVDPLGAIAPGAPVLHDGFPGNLASERAFRYGDPEKAFADAPHRFVIDVKYPRNSCTPIETYGVVASHDAGEDAFEVLANFQGPFSIHTVIARALKVPGNRLRLRTPPESGGSFGVKQGVFPYIVLIAAAARITGRPVKWIEDRLEHLTASVSATNRATTLAAAVAADGKILALDWDQVEDCGAHLRAPEPATLYRMHGNMTGAYDIGHVRIRNRVVVTNKTPTGLNRGFGGPQVYFALERLVQRIAINLGLDPLAVIKRNLIDAGAFPHRTATGALLDSGNYHEAVARAVEQGRLAELKARRDEARAQGRLYGIGFAAVVEPSVSNMGYITTVLTAAERRKAGPKNGAQATATVGLDPVGSVTVHVASVPQGQGHRTVLSQVVADVFGLQPTDIRVNTEIDTAKDAWSIASGNYASRFAAAVAGTAKLAAERVAGRLARIAASQLNVEATDIVFAKGFVASRHNPENRIAFSRVAALSHWSPGSLPDDADQTIRETVFWTPPELTPPDADDRINSSLCHGFIFDFCGLEIDRTTLETRIDRYVTMHDCGTILHPGMVNGQIRGGFAQALGAALYEEYAYADDGSFLTGTLADYLLPTTTEVPEPEIIHMETPSPFTPLGAKGVGEGNCMSTPVCIANAVADALGVADVTLPLVPARLAELVRGAEPPPPAGGSTAAAAREGDRRLRGEGQASVKGAPEQVWAMLLDPNTLQSVIPGCQRVDKITDTHFRADVTLGIGPVSGRYRADVELFDLDPPRAVTLRGGATGALGFGNAEGRITLAPDGEGGTNLTYSYDAAIGGKVASIGGRLLDGATRVIIGQFFTALARKAGGGGASGGGFSMFALLAKVASLFGGASMKPPAFDYLRAETVGDVLDGLTQRGGDARVLAGGQSLMAMLNMRLAKPKLLIDIMRLKELRKIERQKNAVVIGAGVRQADLLAWPDLAEALPLVALALPWVGHMQTRSRGTICGSLAHADPSAEMPLSLLALGGEVMLRNGKRRRHIAAKDFFAGTMLTARADDELIEGISVPVIKGSRFAFREVARRHGDFAIVACAAMTTPTGVRLAVGGVADVPTARDWPRLEGTALDDALNGFAYELGARDDVHATARYRRDLVRMIGRDLIGEVQQ